MNELLDLLYPPRCAGCGAAGDWFCARCRERRDRATPRRPRHLRSLSALGRFEGPLRAAVHRLKYGRESILAEPLGRLLGERVAEGLARGWRVDALVPVPLAPERARARGFDQAERLARSAARASGVPCRRSLLRRRATASQVGLGRAARAANVRGAFVAREVARSVVLVDDVATTGATLAECARALRRAGAREVRAVVVAIET